MRLVPKATLAIACMTIACTDLDQSWGPGADSVPKYSGGGIGGQHIAGNGPGNCMLEDTQNAGFIQNAGDMNCTSGDIAIAAATVSEYSINGGPFLPFVPGHE